MTGASAEARHFFDEVRSILDPIVQRLGGVEVHEYMTSAGPALLYMWEVGDWNRRFRSLAALHDRSGDITTADLWIHADANRGCTFAFEAMDEDDLACHLGLQSTPLDNGLTHKRLSLWKALLLAAAEAPPVRE